MKRGMGVAGGVGADQPVELVQHRVDPLALLGQGRGQGGANRGGRGLPDGLVAEGFEVIEDAVQRAVGGGAEPVPILGVEVGGGVGQAGCRGGLHTRAVSVWSGMGESIRSVALAV